MLFSTTALLALSTVVFKAALPVVKRAVVTDADILQSALTVSTSTASPQTLADTHEQLEHLENAFYKQALFTMPLSALTAANVRASFYDQLSILHMTREDMYFTSKPV